MKTLLRSADGQSAIVFVAFGLLTMAGALQYNIGTPGHMGAGFFPIALGGGLTLVGIAVGWVAIRDQTAVELPQFHWRAVIAILAAVAAGGYILTHFGLVPAIGATTLIGALAVRKNQWLEVIVTAIGLSIAGWLIFVLGLGLPIPLIRF